MTRRPTLFLFDLDGTLVSTNGIGKLSLRAAFRELLGRDALALGLCDELGTSDDWLMKRREGASLLSLRCKRKKRVVERMMQSVEAAPAAALERIMQRLWEQRLER